MELELLAFIASSIGVCGCLPQIIKIIRTNETEALSYSTYFMIMCSGILWVTYGLMAPVYSIVFWNSFSTIMAVVIISLKAANEHKFDKCLNFYHHYLRH